MISSHGFLMRQTVYIDNQTKKKQIDESQIYLLSDLVLRHHAKEKNWEIGIILVSDVFIMTLNKKYFTKDTPTDVISLKFNDEESLLIEGEVFISLDTAMAQAKEYKVTFQDEVNRLVVHGILHLLGYADNTVDERNYMKKLEDMELERLTKSIS